MQILDDKIWTHFLDDKFWTDFEFMYFWMTNNRDLFIPDTHGCTAFSWACLTAEDPNDHSIVKKLVDAGSDIHSIDQSGRNGLHHAVNNNNLELTKYLLELGCDFLLKEEKGKTPLDIGLADALTPPALIELLQQKMANYEKGELNRVLDSSAKKLPPSRI